MRSLLHRFDYQVTKNIQQWPEWVQPIMQFASFVGHPVFTVGIGIGIVGLAWLRTNARLAAAGITVLLTMGIGSLLKLFLHRDRPMTDYVLAMRLETFSFPSGHALGATVAYGLLAYFATTALPAPWNAIVVTLLVLLVIAVGLSRIYLGAHYPSDVLAGWALGLVSLVIIIFVINPKL